MNPSFAFKLLNDLLALLQQKQKEQKKDKKTITQLASLFGQNLAAV